MNTNKAAKVLEKAFAEWRKLQTLKRGKTSIREFAEYLGYSQAAVGFWINGDRNISKEALSDILKKLESLLGTEIYDELEIQKPNPLLEKINSIWERIPPEKQMQIAKEAERYEEQNIPRTQKQRKPRETK